MSSFLLIDSHCHLADEKFAKDLPEVLERAAEAGVRAILDIGDTIESSRIALDHARQFSRPALFATVGVHPHNSEGWSDSDTAAIAALAQSDPDRVVAIGEIGLDYHYDFSPREDQKRAFFEQARLAIEMKLPVVMHCREAYADFIEIIERPELAGLRGVVHCFSGSVEDARLLVGQGFYLGVDGPITFKKNQNIVAMVEAVGLAPLLIETDAPYLAPVPNRGKRNEPAWLVHILNETAEVLGLPADIVAAKIYENTLSLFALESLR
ncbi:MAG: TatD family hydrolase [Candidatus Sumerlaeia bacterium]